MDELTAYKILQIEPGSSRDEIKESYALLSKQFHPEEHPEEFQKIHEAYVTLTRNNRRNHEVSREATVKPRVEHETPEFDFSQIPHQEEKQKDIEELFDQEEAYDFEQTLENAEKKEQERIHELTLQALAEIRILLGPNYRNKMKLFQEFFKNEKYRDALKTPEFLLEFANLLSDTKLKKEIYDYIIAFYRFRSLKSREQLIPEAMALYDVLEQKRGIHAGVESKAQYAIPIGAVVVFRAIRTVVRHSEMLSEVLAMLVLLVLVIWLCRFIYKKLYANHSHIFSQFIVALGLFVINFIAVGVDLYAPLFADKDAGTLFGSLMVVGALGWMAVLAVIEVIWLIVKKYAE